MAHRPGRFTHQTDGHRMIPGNFYTASDIEVTLDTGIILTGATVSIFAKFQDGTEKEYNGDIVDFSKIKATITAEDNTQPGEVMMQAKAAFEDATAIGELESLFVLNSFAPAP